MTMSVRFLGPPNSGLPGLPRRGNAVTVLCSQLHRCSGWLDVSRPGFSISARPSGGTGFLLVTSCLSEIAHEIADAGGTQRCNPLLESKEGEAGVWSVVIPTFDRLPILTKCLEALERQTGYEENGIRCYEIIVVDDGSSDGTVDFLLCNEVDDHNPSVLPQQSKRYPHVKVLRQQHAGATKARNLGLRFARGATIVFIDSDLVVTELFLKSHSAALKEAFAKDGDDRAFTYGSVVNTANFDNPTSEPFKLTDMSAAFFATGNVAISRRRLHEAWNLLGPSADGPFDADFSEYGWEDLELGERLRQGGARIQQAPDAVGFHWHPAFTCEQIPRLVDQERQRGRNGVRFYRKHPNLNVRLMIQMTPFHECLWFLLTLGGLVNERTLAPLLDQLVASGRPGLAAALLSPVLNWHTVQAVKLEVRKLKADGLWIKNITHSSMG